MACQCPKCGMVTDAASCPNCGAQLGYGQPAPVVYGNVAASAEDNHMTIGQWVLTIFLSQLSIVGLILLFVWAFGERKYPSRKNFARAMLIWSLVGVIIFALFAAMVVPEILDFRRNSGYFY